MPDPDPTTSSPETTTPAPDPQREAFARILDFIEERTKQGEPRREVEEDVATKLGWTPDVLRERANAHAKDGDVGRGIVETVTTIVGSVQQMSNERDGKREVASLANDKKLGDAFETHGSKFTDWLREQKINYGGLSEPGRAREYFDYYLKTKTDFFEKKQADKEAEIRKQEREKVMAEMGVRKPAPAAPSLPSGGRPEGGSLRSLMNSTLGASTEPSETQTGIMTGLGLSAERQKKAMEQQGKKTVFGTPLDFVKTKNEGAV